LVKARRAIVFTLTGLAAIAGGFLVAQAVGEDSDQPSLGSVPSTVSVESSDSRVPRFTPHAELPPLRVTTATTEATGEEGSGGEVESEYEPESTYTPAPEEKSPYVPPSKTPTAAPEVTVGKNE
jgi:hypothetical protein